jgi:uncharacterized protein YrrD
MAGEATSPGHVERALRESEAYLADGEDGTEVGVVDKVLFDEAGRVAGIEVCAGWFGRRRLTFDVRDVIAVWPRRRRVYLSDAAVARTQDPSR